MHELLKTVHFTGKEIVVAEYRPGFQLFLFSDRKEDVEEDHVDFTGAEDFTEEDLKVSYNVSELGLKAGLK